MQRGITNPNVYSIWNLYIEVGSAARRDHDPARADGRPAHLRPGIARAHRLAERARGRSAGDDDGGRNRRGVHRLRHAPDQHRVRRAGRPRACVPRALRVRLDRGGPAESADERFPDRSEHAARLPRPGRRLLRVRRDVQPPCPGINTHGRRHPRRDRRSPLAFARPAEPLLLEHDRRHAAFGREC